MKKDDEFNDFALGLAGVLVLAGGLYYLIRPKSKSYESMKAVPLNALVAELTKRLN